MLEKKEGMSDITTLNLWPRTCKKQSWIISCYWIDIEKKKTEATRSAAYRRQKFCVKLLRRTKKEFYYKPNAKYITEINYFG